MDWQARLRREGIMTRGRAFDLVYHVSLRPAIPPEYDVGGVIGITFRLARRAQGGHVFVTALDPAGALRLGERFGLDEGAALAMVDSHERMHVMLQLEGVAEDVEEQQTRVVDAAWLSLREPTDVDDVRAGERGVTL